MEPVKTIKNREFDDGIKDLINKGTLVGCSCDQCTQRAAEDGLDIDCYTYNLKDSDYYLFYDLRPSGYGFLGSYSWMRIECNCPNPCYCSHGEGVNFKEIFDKGYEDLLFHLDLFA